MKRSVLTLATGLLFLSILSAQDLNLTPSRIFAWDDLPAEQNDNRITRHISEGSTTHLAYFEMQATTINPQKMAHAGHTYDDLEEIIIVTEGEVEVTIEDEKKVLGPNSMALILPGDEHGFQNVGNTPATYFSIKYRSKAPMDLSRGKLSGGSFWVDFEDLEFKPHENGGRRDYFDHPTAMCESFEMHVTDLRAGVESHPPHTHVVEEIVLITAGDVSVHIDGDDTETKSGDLVFLDSNVPHSAANIGKTTSRYFAFQWK